MLNEKIFRQIYNHPDYYVSQDGEDKVDKENGVIIKPFLSTNGYLRLYIDGKQYSIHRLVAETFIPNPQNLATVNHKNHIKTDNRVDNLEWMSLADNVRDAVTKIYRVYHTKNGYIGEYRGMQAVSDAIGIDKQRLYKASHKSNFINPNLIFCDDYIIHKETAKSYCEGVMNNELQ